MNLPSDQSAELDMRGTRCPAPIIALGRYLRAGATGPVALLADDPAAEIDVPAWCRLTGSELLSAEPVDHNGADRCVRYTIELPPRSDRSG